MTYADGYRAGLEAAARLHDRLSEWAYEAEEDPKCGQMHRDFAERIRALAPAAPEPSEADWMPIETAPRDGTWIMAWRPPCDGGWEPLVIVRWHEDEDGEGSWAWPDEAYDPYSEKGRTLAEGALDDGDCFWDNEHFTHWMPLPAAPALAQVEKADG